MSDHDGDDGGWTMLSSNVPVAFGANLSAPATKTALPTGTHFGVFAYYTGTSNWNSVKNSTAPNFMYNQEVAFDGTSCTYSPLKYWPNNTNEKVTFWAYCPYSASPVIFKQGTNNDFDNTTKNIPDIRFTVTDGQTDFMISDLAANKTKPASATPVELTFKHTLSKLSFYVKKVDPIDKYTVKLKNIRVDGIYLTAVHRSSGWMNWASPRGSVSVLAPADASGYPVLATSYPASGSPQGATMLLPQSLDYEYAMLHIEYTIDFAGLLQTRTMISNSPLSLLFEDLDPVAWAEGKEYNVFISITPDDPIEFSVTWSNWGTVHNNHISN